MKLAYEMKYTHPTDEVTSVRMIPYSSTFQEAYREMYNECYHEMRDPSACCGMEQKSNQFIS